MKEELEEYAHAFEAHLRAQQDEMKIKQVLRVTRNRLFEAKQMLRNKEKDLLDEAEKITA